MITPPTCQVSSNAFQGKVQFLSAVYPVGVKDSLTFFTQKIDDTELYRIPTKIGTSDGRYQDF